LRAPEPERPDLIPHGCIPTVPQLTLPETAGREPPPIERALAPDTVVLHAPVSLHRVDRPTLSGGVLRVHVRLHSPPEIHGSSCTLRVFWDGDAHGETASAPPHVVAPGGTSSDWEMSIPVQTGDEGVLAVDGILRCPGIERHLAASYIGGPGAAARYCALCPEARLRPPEQIMGEVGSRLSVLLVRRGVAARVKKGALTKNGVLARGGALIDACDGRVILDLAAAGFGPVEYRASSEQALLEETEARRSITRCTRPRSVRTVPT
jgi:hypothetical protein